ncbi:MAG TPA: phosphoribosyl-ATP pyrophosphohydrolase [Candidatus Parcubacteria bacterium]|nr:phosphoribosyl-ATP pyrophosphohydrolase [Candidatus Parcubacteria bacterium]
MRKIYNKLIRDKIPEIIERNGGKHKIRILNDEEYKKELLKKIVEEAREVLETSGDKKELTKEIGDVLEIINYLVRVFDLDREKIETTRQARKESRGGFDKKLFLEYTDD